MMNGAHDIDDILYGEIRIRQPRAGEGPRVSVDTVLLADMARARPSARVVEMGCAHGAIALLIAKRRKAFFGGRDMPPIVGFDINADLVEMARDNAIANGLADQVELLTLDLRRVRGRYAAESFDAVVMNPPFDEPSTAPPSPASAVAAARGGTECTLAEVVAAAKYLLKNGGKFFTVMRARRAAELIVELASANMRAKRLCAVHPRPDREAASVLVEAVRDGGEGLIVEPPLFICGMDGEYTRDLLGAYTLREVRERCPS